MRKEFKADKPIIGSYLKGPCMGEFCKGGKLVLREIVFKFKCNNSECETEAKITLE